MFNAFSLKFGNLPHHSRTTKTLSILLKDLSLDQISDKSKSPIFRTYSLKSFMLPLQATPPFLSSGAQTSLKSLMNKMGSCTEFIRSNKSIHKSCLPYLLLGAYTKVMAHLKDWLLSSPTTHIHLSLEFTSFVSNSPLFQI